MTTTDTPSGSRGLLLALLGLGLLAMAAALLWQRLQHPALTEEIAHRGMTMGEGGTKGGREDDHVGQLMRAAQQNPDDAPTLISLAEHLIQHGQFEAAATFARRARQVALEKAASAPAPDSPTALAGQAGHLLAIVLHNQGKHAEAATQLETVLKETDDPMARYSLGVLYIHFLNKPTAGIRELTQALHSERATPDLKKLVEQELERAPLPTQPDTPQEGASGGAAPSGDTPGKDTPGKDTPERSAPEKKSPERNSPEKDSPEKDAPKAKAPKP